MKAVMLYRPNSEFARKTEEFVRDFKTRSSHEITLLDYDSVEGQRFAEARDIVAIPALVIVEDNGGVLKHWQGPHLPLFNEVAAYLV